MPKCPNGHDSTWDDFCSSCGEAISAAAGQSTTSPDPGSGAGATAEKIGLTCTNCSARRGELDVFCESCGYDFASGTLPTAETGDPTPSAPEAASPATGPTSAGAVAAGTAGGVAVAASAATSPPGEAAPVPDEATTEGEAGGLGPLAVAMIVVDRPFFNRVAGGGELVFPDPEPAEVRVPLNGSEILIGRRSDSRGIYPEIDLSPPMDDPAVSHRHAMLRRSEDGSWTITDLDSTNGTYLGDHTVAMVANKEKPLPIGTAVFVGAYTKVTLAEA